MRVLTSPQWAKGPFPATTVAADMQLGGEEQSRINGPWESDSAISDKTAAVNAEESLSSAGECPFVNSFHHFPRDHRRLWTSCRQPTIGRGGKSLAGRAHVVRAVHRKRSTVVAGRRRRTSDDRVRFREIVRQDRGTEGQRQRNTFGQSVL